MQVYSVLRPHKFYGGESMKTKSLWKCLFLCAGLFFLLVDRETAMAGAQTGVNQCIQAVIPSLLPLFLISNMLIHQLYGTDLIILKPMANLLRIPEGGSSLLISFFLGGYPMGAQAVANAWHRKLLSRQDTERLLYFCSNAGPAFLLGMAGPMFPKPWMVWSLWGIHIGSAILVSLLIPASPNKMTAIQKGPSNSSQAMAASLSSIANVCGWVICFSVLSACMSRWILYRFSIPIQVAVSGSLELISGCCMLPLISSVPIRYILFSAMLGLGGICVTMQTASILQGLPLRNYIIGKLLQCVLSLCFSSCLMLGFWPILLLVPIIFATILPKFKKSSGISLKGAV